MMADFAKLLMGLQAILASQSSLRLVKEPKAYRDRRAVKLANGLQTWVSRQSGRMGDSKSLSPRGEFEARSQIGYRFRAVFFYWTAAFGEICSCEH
jgi:hypothetical protein